MVRNLFFILCFLIFQSLIGQPDYREEIDSLTEIGFGYMYSNRDSAYHFFNRAKDLSEQHEDWVNVLNTLSFANSTAGYFSDLTYLRKNISEMENLLEIHSATVDTFSQKRTLVNSLFYDKGNYLFQIDEYAQSRKAFNALLDDLESIPSEALTEDDIYYQSVVYSFLAKMLFNEKKYGQAREYYDRNARLLKQELPNEENLLMGNYALLGEVLREEGNIQGSNRNFGEVLSFDLKRKTNPNRIVSAGLNLAENHLALSQRDSANYYLNLVRPFLGESFSMHSFFLRTEAQIRSEEGQFQEAEDLLRSAISTIESMENPGQGLTLSGLYLELGKIQSNSGELEKALQTLEKGLEASGFAVEPYTIDILYQRAKIFNRLKNYKAAIASVNQGITVLDSLKISFVSPQDKSALIEASFPLFEAGLTACHRVYEKNSEAGLVGDAFRFMEKSKGILLLDALMSVNAEQFSNIPEEALEALSELRAEIALLEKDIALVNHSKNNLKNLLFEKRKTYDQLISSIEKKYPAYYALKYGTETIGLQDARRELREGEGLLSFFYGDEQIFAVLLQKDTGRIVSIGQPVDLAEDIDDFYRLLSDPNSDLTVLTARAKMIYTQLLGSLDLESLHTLTVITDGPLNYLPFEALMNNSTDNYLIEELSISYANSATSLDQLNKKQFEGRGVMAFAPEFQGEEISPSSSRDILAPLPFSKQEVIGILNVMRGKAFLDNRASVANFRSKAGDYGILHFATHASFNNRDPELSYLAFSPKTEQPLLYVKDFYNLNLNANLVTLSACETALGDLRRGEGFIGLSSGFFYGGAKSIVSTLWRINDGASSRIMTDFYAYLGGGENKKNALRKAKLDFIRKNEENALAHPYYWAGAIITGDASALPNTGFKAFWILGLAFVGLLVYGILTRRYSNRLSKRVAA